MGPQALQYQPSEIGTLGYQPSEIGILGYQPSEIRAFAIPGTPLTSAYYLKCDYWDTFLPWRFIFLHIVLSV